MSSAIGLLGLCGFQCPQMSEPEGITATSCGWSPSLASWDPSEPALCMEGRLSPVQQGLAPGSSHSPRGLQRPWDLGVEKLELCGGPECLPDRGGLCLQHHFVPYCFRPSGLTCSSASQMKKAPTW